MNDYEAQSKLQSIGQQFLLDHVNKLTPQEKELLYDQIQRLNILTFFNQQKLIQQPKELKTDLQPFEDYAHAGNQQDFEAGKKLIQEGKTGCILMAGGQGTRLRFSGPKGMFPVTPVMHKSLFQWFAERVIAAGNQAGRLLPLAIMTSPLNDQAIRHFFYEHENFGLKPEQLYFFSQQMLPFLDDKGDLLLENPYRIAEGPDGNGFSLKYFVESGIWQKWRNLGIQFVNYVLIDNPLADPYDAELFGFQARQQIDATVKCTVRRDAMEKVGILTRNADKVTVTEYTELSNQERHAIGTNGVLKHLCANLSLFCFNMDFIQNASKENLPLHLAHKAVQGTEIKAWKFEAFIFDVLQYSNNVRALLYSRERCFAPLKNFEGDDSLETVQKALEQDAKRIYREISGLDESERHLELSADFYFPTEKLLRDWRGRVLPEGIDYIVP